MLDCLPPECNIISVKLADPKSFKSAVNRPDGGKWMESCQKEIKEMVDRQVWRLVKRPLRPTNIIRGL